jgi:hypothetical protein
MNNNLWALLGQRPFSDGRPREEYHGGYISVLDKSPICPVIFLDVEPLHNLNVTAVLHMEQSWDNLRTKSRTHQSPMISLRESCPRLPQIATARPSCPYPWRCGEDCPEAMVGSNTEFPPSIPKACPGLHVYLAGDVGRENEHLGVDVGGLKLWVEVLAQDNRGLSEVKELRPQSQEAPGRPNDFSELMEVVGLLGGSMMPGGLSTQVLANVAVRDWSDDFTFIIGDHCYRCRASVAHLLPPVSGFLRPAKSPEGPF